MSNQIFPTLKGIDINVDRSQVFNTMVQTAVSGKEQRAAWWTAPRYKWQIQVNFARQTGFSTNTPKDELGTLHAFFMQHRGSWDSFLYLDPYDSSDTAMGFGVGNGSTTAFQLQRREPGTYTNMLGTFNVSTTPRQNIILYSQSIDNGAWSKSLSSVLTDWVVAPDGTKTADALVETTSTGLHYALQTFTAADSSVITASIYAQAATRTQIRIEMGTKASALGYAHFDLVAGTVMSSSGLLGATITPFANGWYRCVATINIGTGASTPYLAYVLLLGGSNSYTGISGAGLPIWQAQVELGAVATEPILTTAASVTVSPSYYPGTDGFEPVTEPAPGITIYKAGVALAQGADWTMGAGGVVTFTVPPASGAALTWTGGYYRRVRFDMDEMDFQRIMNLVWGAGQNSQTINLISVK